MIEIVRPGVSARHARVVLFDFDGTLSLIRTGWVNVMVPMMVEILLELKTGESEEQLRTIVEDFVARLTGKQTIYQMIELARQVELRGGKPLDPLVYKKMYLERLHEKIKDRREALRTGEAPPDRYLVPGARALLEQLKQRGLKMYLASGTDQEYAREEARLLDIDRYFDGGVWGALDDYKSFSKAILIQRMIQAAECRGDDLLGFGDGYVEIENVKAVGGVAVGVATDEPACQQVDQWKRNRLIGVGADLIVPNYLCRDELLAILFGK
ncbi:MAG: HAD family hydrolase [Bryobacterales bacterium]|nr:HAD family hydrolase [Bryobacteraceae bacterium]MDW8128931.1 HAD family hydrolase [Bryobacterales bacterium]